MTEDISSLNKLHGIVLPEPPLLWPPASGVWVIALFILCFMFFIVYRQVRNHKLNRYRRAGLLLLNDVETVYELSVILKRVALVVYPREQVAPLHGEEWRDFLNKTCRSCKFSSGILNNYNSAADLELIDCARIWIKKHRASDTL